MAPSYKPKNLFSREHWHALQVFTIDTILFEDLTIATQIYLFQP